MDYETLDVLYRSRKTLLKLLAMRGYNTKPYEKFGPIEIAAMAAATGTTTGATAFRMDLERPAGSGPITKCRVEYSINRIKNRISGFLDGLTEEGNEASITPENTELVAILLEPVVETFHIASMNALATKSLHVSFFQAHTIVNNPLEHVLVPKHELLPSSEHTAFLAEHKIKSKANLPLIKFHEDMIARVIGLMPGDIVKITRPSPSAGEYISYRVCVP
jgi:DNA-directed RNA polymerase I, II, and III subunit RPABC1